MALHSDHHPESELAGKKSWIGSCSQKDSNQQKSERQDNTMKLHLVCHGSLQNLNRLPVSKDAEYCIVLGMLCNYYIKFNKMALNLV